MPMQVDRNIIMNTFMPQQPVQAAAGQPVEEDVSINIAGHKIKGRLIMKIAAPIPAGP